MPGYLPDILLFVCIEMDTQDRYIQTDSILRPTPDGTSRRAVWLQASYRHSPP